MSSIPEPLRPALFQYLLRLGDDRLILGHRLSEWCGHGPFLEEDIALANIALDEIGQASALLHLAGDVEGKGRDEDRLAYFRVDREFCNCQLVELPRGDFAFTIARQFLFDAFAYLHLDALKSSGFAPLADVAAKAVKETKYHLRHSSEWMLRLGDGTPESHTRVADALRSLWKYTAELFEKDEVDTELEKAGLIPHTGQIAAEWRRYVEDILSRATLPIPNDGWMVRGSRKGLHSEHLGHLLAEMQILPRSYPDAKW